METSIAGSSHELGVYRALLRRRWAWVTAFTVAGVLVGVGAVAGLPKTYASTAQVLVTPTGAQEQNNTLTMRQREALNLDTEAQIARSAVVAAKASELMANPTTPSELRDATQVNVPPNSSILAITYRAAAPATAAQGAQAVAQAYLAHREAAARTATGEQIKVVEEKIKDLNQRLSRSIQALPGLPKGSADRAIAAQQQAMMSRQINALSGKHDTLGTVTITPGEIISAAQPPTAPSEPSIPLYVGSGFLLGLLAGLAAAVLRDRSTS